MKKEELFETIGEIDEDLAVSALTEGRRQRNSWRRYGALAACLCVVLGGALCYTLWGDSRDLPGITGGGGTDTGGGAFIGEDGTQPGGPWADLPEGMDPITASIASFPAGESLKNVDTAEVLSLTEAEAAGLVPLCFSMSRPVR